MSSGFHHFCTYFDSNYLSRGLALYRSLRAHCPRALLWILCLDSRCFHVLHSLDLPNTRLINLEDFERDQPELVRTKYDRSLVEYYFTCTSSFILYLLEHNEDIDFLTYVDSDFLFFGDPTKVLADTSRYSISIVSHRFPDKLKFLEQIYGTYNVGWISIRRDSEGLSCLRRWRQQCIEWCYDRVEEGRFADQMYLNEWPERYSSVCIINNPGVNLAPFNLANHNLAVEGDIVLVDGVPLVCFHFFGLKSFHGVVYYLSANKYGAKPSRVLIDRIYEPYLQTMRKIQEELEAASVVLPGVDSIREITERAKKRAIHRTGTRVAGGMNHYLAGLSAVLHRRFMVFLNGRVRLKHITCGIAIKS